MRSKLFIIPTIIAVSFAFSACGGGANVTTTPGNTANANSSNPLETKTPMPEVTLNDAPTLSPLFKSYCDAKIKGDEAGLRKVYSTGTLKDFEDQMKEDKVKTLVKFLETDKVTAKLCTIRNEKITGDSAVAEIQFETYPNGIKVVFVKENGEWKMTNRSPAVDSVNKGATTPPAGDANAAKK